MERTHILRAYLPWLAALVVVGAIASLYDAQIYACAASWTQARPEVERLVRFLSNWGNYVFYAGFGLALVVGLARRDTALVRLGLAYFATLLLFSFLAARIIKVSVGRPRPWAGATLECRPLTLEARYHSFPSGHTSDAFAAVVPTFRWLGRGWLAGLLKAGVLVLALLISASRVMLGQHYPTDVVGGAVLSLGGGLALSWWLERWLPPQADHA